MDGSCPMLGAHRLRRALIIVGYAQGRHVEECVTLPDTAVPPLHLGLLVNTCRGTIFKLGAAIVEVFSDRPPTLRSCTESQ